MFLRCTLLWYWLSLNRTQTSENTVGGTYDLRVWEDNIVPAKNKNQLLSIIALRLAY
jgi:hypothetical protein